MVTREKAQSFEIDFKAARGLPMRIIEYVAIAAGDSPLDYFSSRRFVAP